MRHVSTVRERMVSWLCQLRLVWVMLVTENRKKKPQILCLKRQMKIIKKSAVFQEEWAAATAALLSPSAPTCRLLPTFPYACALMILCFLFPFSPHCLSLLTLSLDICWGACSSVLLSVEHHSPECFTPDKSLIATEAQLAQQGKRILGNIPFRSCSVMANLLNRFIWCTEAAASIKTHFELDHFQCKIN